MPKRILIALFSLAASCFAMAGLGAEITSTMEAGTYPYPIRVFFASDDRLASLSYRFEGAKNMRPLDDALFLEALMGEERVYSIFVEARNAQGRSETASFLFRIDRKPPETPLPSQVPGFVLPGTSVYLASAGAARIVYSLMPAQGEALEYGEAIRIPDYQDGIVRYSLSAVAIDDMGNASYPFSGEYVSVPKGYQPASDLSVQDPGPGSSAMKSDPDRIEAVSLETATGFAIKLSHPRALAFRYAAREPSPTPGEIASYSVIEANKGEALLGVSAPQGWVGSISIAIAAETGRNQFLPPSRDVSLTFAEKDVVAKGESVKAKLVPASRSRGAWFFAENSRANLRYQVEGREPLDYSGPVFIPASPGKDSLKVNYSSLFRDGTRSKEESIEILLPADPGRPEIDGMPANRVSSSTIILSPGQNAKVLRYELVSKEGTPKPVGSGSPVFQPNSAFNAPENATVVYRLRLRSFSGSASDAVGGDEAFIDFAVDRTPPEPPAIKEQTGLSGAPDKFFGFDSGNDEIYYRVSRNGLPQGSYVKFTEPVRLPADADGPVTYAIQSYAIDLAGNRSAESKFENIIIDATSVYLAGWGSDQNDGSPSSPYLSLEAALKNAVITGRDRIKVAGSPKPSGDIIIEGDISIEGGFGRDWSSNDGAPALISIKSIYQKSGRLSVEGVEITGANAKGSAFLNLDASAASFKRSTIRIVSQHEDAIALSRGAQLEIADCAIQVKAKGRFTALMAEGSKVSVTRSTLSLEGADVGTAISMVGGALGMDGSSVSCDCAQSSATLALSDSVFQASRSLFDAKAAKGFAACLFSRGSSVIVETSLFRSSRSAETVFFDASGGSLALSNVTAFADGSPRAAYAFRVVGCAIELRNSVFAVMNDKADGALFDGIPDPKGLQSICSAGFKKLLKGKDSEALKARVLVADPASLFEIDAKGWPRLTKDSPLIDSGNVPEGFGSSDWYGNPRPSKYGKGLPDIGAFEYQ